MKNSRKKVVVTLLTLLLAIFILPFVNGTTASAKKKVHVSKVAITKPAAKSLTLPVGKTYSLKVKVTPSKASNKKVSYKSSNSKVVSVNSKGKLIAKKKGTAKITVTAKDGSKKKAVLTVKVVIPVSKIKITAPSMQNMVLAKGKHYTIKTTVTPSNASNKKLAYTSSNSKVLSVNSKGVVTAKKSGSAIITVKAADGSKKKATVKLIVGTPVTKVTVAQTTVKKTVGSSFNINAKVTPSNATTKALKYTSSNTSLATVDSKGKVTLKKVGTVKITAKTTDGSNKSAVCTVVIQKPAPKPPVTPPVKPEPDKDDNNYSLVWQDNFDGTELNTKDWNYELHEPGWVNHEWQQYTDSKENTYVKDGHLVIQAVKTEDETGAHYTSGRINTQGKHDYKYGKFEIRAKAPSGKGFLPAIWMMPTNENLYGQWPKCGEIDIMEVLGHQTNTTYGTLHFGEPHTQKQGSYTLPASDFASGYHTYTCEWEPSEIRFYVDGILFNTVNDWFTKKTGFGEVTYPAPFDQDFYLILNLAVGGDWPGSPDETTEFGENAQLLVDYVKVYQKKNYDENVKKPVINQTFRNPDQTGNYIVNGNFSLNESLSDATDWSFLLAGNGDAAAIIKDNALHITTINSGELDYSVQVVQPNLPMEKGYRYRLSFDASASEARTMIADISGPDNGYIRYFNDTSVALTTEQKHYAYEFDMTNASDANGRVEFNLGNQNSTADVSITNVRVEKIGKAEIPEEVKTLLPDGNYIYNGEFQEGSNRLDYWTIQSLRKDAIVSVTNTNNVRELKVFVPNVASTPEQVIVTQDPVALAGNKTYVLYFDAYSDTNKVIKTLLAGETFKTTLTKQKTTYKYTFTTKDGLTTAKLQFLLGAAGTAYIDNVRIQEDGLLINGDFINGFSGFEVFTDSSISSSVTYSVDGQHENNAAAFDIQDTGDADWKIQLKQNNISLENGKWYTISLDAKSTITRKIMYALQRDGSSDNDWTPYSGTQVIELTNEFKTFTTTFQMTSKTDLSTILSISMGSVDGVQITVPHTVTIDNIKLNEVTAPQN
ncbi:MAG: Ig-like domain-containing protein [bacterium]|nr:Ig-like domain-containing protein [bacterium]